MIAIHFCLLSLCALPSPQQVELQLELPPGLEAVLWAESPQIYNPTAMDVDERGRLWVTEAVNYRKWGGRNPGLDHEGGDRVVVLADTNGDGVCDSSKVFAQGPELVSPLGILVLGAGRVLVSCSPSAILYTDDDGDDVADRQEIFLTGFGGHDHDHGLHLFVPGPDGALYVATGNWCQARIAGQMSPARLSSNSSLAPVALAPVARAWHRLRRFRRLRHSAFPKERGRPTAGPREALINPAVRLPIAQLRFRWSRGLAVRGALVYATLSRPPEPLATREPS